MLFGDIVEPTDNLYKEGNIINKHTQKRKGKKYNKEAEKTKGKRKESDKEDDGSDGSDGTGLMVDFEV